MTKSDYELAQVDRVLELDKWALEDLQFALDYLSTKDDVYWDDLFDTCRLSKELGDGCLSLLVDYIGNQGTDSYVRSFCVQLVSRARFERDDLRNAEQFMYTLDEANSIGTRIGEEVRTAHLLLMTRIGLDNKSKLLATIQDSDASFTFRLYMIWLLFIRGLKKVVRLKKMGDH